MADSRIDREFVVHCSLCGKPFDERVARYMPFCSERCKMIDLGRWLDEAYGLPHDPTDEPTEPPGDGDSAD